MIEKTIRDNLLAIAGRYRKATGQSWSQLSKEFYGNSDFFQALRANKRSISASTLEKLVDMFRDQWPPKANWPPTKGIFMTRTPI
jgi:hypothetical protein